MPEELPFLNDLGVKIISDAILCDCTTFKVGGPCRALIECTTPQQLESVIKKLAERKMDFIVIGSGSNLLVSDAGIDIIVIKYVSWTPIIERARCEVTISASSLLDDLARFAVDNSLCGINFASWIPGTVGGAICGNAGAFGKQISESLKSVVIIEKCGNKREIDAKSLDFSYRHSSLKNSGDIVLEARFEFTISDSAELLKERQEILKSRKENQPDVENLPCAGSFFRNIEPKDHGGRRQAAARQPVTRLDPGQLLWAELPLRRPPGHEQIGHGPVLVVAWPEAVQPIPFSVVVVVPLTRTRLRGSCSPCFPPALADYLPTARRCCIRSPRSIRVGSSARSARSRTTICCRSGED